MYNLSEKILNEIQKKIIGKFNNYLDQVEIYKSNTLIL